MDGGRELVGTRPGDAADLLQGTSQLVAVDTLSAPSVPVRKIDLEVPASRTSRWIAELKFPVVTYLATRVLLLAIAIAGDGIFSGVVRRISISGEFANWDGWWYVRVATLGYPTQVSHSQTTLGFLPVYSMTMWLVAHIFSSSYVIAGMIISGVGGLVATVLIQRLTTEWWGPQVARKAVLLFCLFPGTIIFSMDYSEGLLIPLLAGCMLALHHRRWLLAGVLAGIATGIGPDALVVIPMCATASLVQLWRYGWQDGEARRSLVAPLLAPFGAAAFSLFLWFWTGSPFASLIAQKAGWHESTSPFALPNQLVLLLKDIGPRFRWWNINLNIIVGLLGAAFLVVGLRWLWRDRGTLPLEVQVFTACMTFLMVTSWHVPPNPRMLITGFPVVLIFAKWLHDRAWTRFIWCTGAMLVVLSTMTYVGSVLRP